MCYTRILAVALMAAFLLTACQSQAIPEIQYNPQNLQFSGERALALEADFVNQFPNRHSGQPHNSLAATWIFNHFTQLGWDCKIDQWEVINYSRPFPLNNVVCLLPGEAAKEILVVAHLDQASTTVQGADNDGSGIAILLHLAEILTTEQVHPYTLAFVATDAEEYGMLGTQRYIKTHANTKNIIAGIILDNLGQALYHDMDMELIGQYRNYGPVWLALAAHESAQAAGLDWTVNLRSPVDQTLDQAAPISFMDQGPIVAAEVPALGFYGHKPPEFADLHYQLWHDPGDTITTQSAASLAQSGLIAESLIRQLLSMKNFPRETGPYLYFDETQQVLRGLPLWLFFIGFVGIFLLGSLLANRKSFKERLQGWHNTLPHFLGLWLPLLASIVLLYGLVAVGVMVTYDTYPATTKDPDLFNPRWPAIILFVIGLAIFLYLGRYIVKRYGTKWTMPQRAEIKSFALLIVALCGMYVLAINPFSLLFFVPLLFWLLIGVRKGFGRMVDIVLFLLGGLVVYALVYSFGFLNLRYDWAFLWYLLNMFSIRMIGFPTAAMITAIVAAGLTMIINPPKANARSVQI